MSGKYEPLKPATDEDNTIYQGIADNYNMNVKDLQQRLTFAEKRIVDLEYLAKEYDDLIRYMDAGGDFFAFMVSKRFPDNDRNSYPAKCSKSDFHCTYPECTCGR